jgi:hypothetical protein
MVCATRYTQQSEAVEKSAACSSRLDKTDFNNTVYSILHILKEPRKDDLSMCLRIFWRRDCCRRDDSSLIAHTILLFRLSHIHTRIMQ